MEIISDDAVKEIENNINYIFKDKGILIHALTHSSYANEHMNPLSSNERFEFLGDSVLSFVTARYLFETYKDMPEGDLSKLRASLVCTQALSSFAHEINLGSYLLLGKGESKSGGRQRDSILENAFEAVIAAIYLDGGMEEARKFIVRFISKSINTHSIGFKDYKTMLQEVIQHNPDQSIIYVMTGESGPDHDKFFEAEVHLNSNVIGKGTGKSKKQAEQEAAKEALKLMGEI